MAAADLPTLLRALHPRVLAAVLRVRRDLQAAEDAVQDAYLAAARQWPRDGWPDNPRAWLIRAASRRAHDSARADGARRERETSFASLIPGTADGADWTDGADDTLLLFFMCAHPALSATSAIALTLRCVGGLTTAELARALLVPEATLAQRLSRARATVNESGQPFERPGRDELPARLGHVRQVLYLLFNEGYAATSGAAVQRLDLCEEALRLTTLLHGMVPDDAEVTGLLALLVLTHARAAARSGPLGELVPLDEQDRSRWDAVAIARGTALLEGALARGTPGPFQVQAAIAAVHDAAPSTDATDWPQLVALYEVLHTLAPSPVVTLNHAVAVAMVQGPEAGLARLEPLASDPRVGGSHRLAAARAHLLERAGRRSEAHAAYELAASRATSTAERDFLVLRAARCRR